MIQSNLWGEENTIPSRNGAIIDPSEMYRYSLWRVWDVNKPRVLWIMLNPSKADADQDDNTLRRCISFSKSWNYGSLEIVNLFAFRATHPNEMKNTGDPVGPLNDRYIQEASERAEMIVCGWGEYKHMGYHDIDMLMRLLVKRECYCLGKTNGCKPRHPLFIPASTKLERYW